MVGTLNFCGVEMGRFVDRYNPLGRRVEMRLLDGFGMR